MGKLKFKFTAIGFLLNLGALTYLLYLSRFQTDPHHDGYIFGSAAAVASGLPVHSGAFSQYGPMTPLVTGIFMKIFGVSVLSMRVLAAIIIFFTYVLIGKTLKRLQFQDFSSRFFAAAWVLLNGVTSTAFDGSLFLWPSVISTFLLMVAVYLVCRSGNLDNRSIALIAAGFFVSLATFTRIQSILVIPAMILFFALRRNFGRQITYVTLGFLLGCATVFAGLFAIKSVDDYVNQVIIWAGTTYPSMGIGNNYDLFQLILFASLAVMMVLLHKTLQMFKVGQRALTKLYFIGLAGMAIFAINWGAERLLLSDKNTYLRLLVGDQFNRILLWPLYFSFLATLVLLFMVITQVSSHKFKVNALNFPAIFAILVGASVTVQIFPKSDVLHLWWISPLLIFPTLLLFRIMNLDLDSVKRTLSVLLIASFFANLVYFSTEREQFSYKPLKGTFGSASKVQGMTVYLPLTTYLQKRNAVFVCEDGIHSVASGRYSSVDSWFVNWGFDTASDESLVRLRNAESIIVCDKERAYADVMVLKFEKRIVYFAEKRVGETYRSLAILENREQG